MFVPYTRLKLFLPTSAIAGKFPGKKKIKLSPRRNFGASYLYRGLDAKLLQSIVAAGFMFLTYEQLAAVIFEAFGVEKKKN